MYEMHLLYLRLSHRGPSRYKDKHVGRIAWEGCCSGGFGRQSTEGELCLFGQKGRVWQMKVGGSTEQVVRVGSKDQVQVLLKAFSGA